MLIQAGRLHSEPCDRDADLICVLCYRDGCDEWAGTVPATRQVTPPNGQEEFVCDMHAANCVYDTERQRLIENRPATDISDRAR